MSMCCHLFALLAGLLAVPTAPPDDAQASDDVAATGIAEVVVVTASRIEESVDDSPMHVTVLDDRALRASAAVTVDDALRQIPGFSLFRRSSSQVAQPTTQGVSLRGIGPSGVSRTLVLLDGIPLNDPFGGWVYWSRVPKESLARVEVVRGGGSNVWGSSALGGVIQLLTRRPDGLEVAALLEGGDRGLAQADLMVGDRRERFGYHLRGNHFSTDGYHTLRADQRGAIDVPADSEHQLLSGRVDLLSGDSVAAFLQSDVFDEERSNGTPLTGNETDTLYFGGGVDWVASGAWQLRVYGHEQEFSSTFSAQQPDRGSERPALDQFLVDSSALGAGLQWTRSDTRSAHRVAAGGEARTIDGETNEDFFFSGSGFNNRRVAGGEQQLAGLFVQDNWEVSPRLQVAAGARIDSWRSEEGRRFERSLITGAARRDDRFADRDETEISPKLGVVYEASARWRWRASAYRAFRAPTINELYRPFRVRNDITEANAQLEPETLSGLEGGVAYSASRFRGSVTAFWNQLKDPVANVTLAAGPGVIAPCGFVPPGGSCRQRRNLDRTRVQGLEAEGHWRVGRRWSIYASYLFDDTEIRRAEELPALVGKQVAQVPENQLVLRVDRGFAGRLHTSLQGRWVDDQFEDDLNRRALDSFTLFDAYAGFRVGSRWDLFAASENLLDEAVEVGMTGDGLVTVGAPRSLRLGVRIDLGR